MNNKEIQDAIDYFTETKGNLNSDSDYYVEVLIQGALELNEEISTLAYENKAMAKTLEELGYNVDNLIFQHREG